MKTKVTFEFDNVSTLHVFNRDVYVKGKFHKNQWDVPTVTKTENGKHKIEYCIGRIAACKLTKLRENFKKDKELMYKNIKIESLV